MNKDEIKDHVNNVAIELNHILSPFRDMIIDGAQHTECAKCGAYTAVVIEDSTGEWITTQKDGDRITKTCEGARRSDGAVCSKNKR